MLRRVECQRKNTKWLKCGSLLHKLGFSHGVQGSDGHLIARMRDRGLLCACLPGGDCSFNCPEGGCKFDCPNDATCVLGVQVV
jgi:hypothetical protein